MSQKHGRLRARWQPKEWTPVYEQITMYSVLGVSNGELAKKFDLTPQMISMILNTDQAKILKQAMIAKIRAEMSDSIEERKIKLAERAMSNVESVLDNEKLLTESPFAMLDRSMKFLQGIGKMGGGEAGGEKGATTNVQNNFIMSDKAAERLIAALGKSEEVQKLHNAIAAEEVKELPKGA